VSKVVGNDDIPETNDNISKYNISKTNVNIDVNICKSMSPTFKTSTKSASEGQTVKKQSSNDGSDTDYWEDNESTNFRRIQGMLSRDRRILVNCDYIYDTALRTAESIRSKRGAKQTVSSQGISAAASELISLEERVSDSTYAKALNYLIHFVTPDECINYLYAVGVKTIPESTIVRNSKTVNGVNSV
jgi:hypothetical protein